MTMLDQNPTNTGGPGGPVPTYAPITRPAPPVDPPAAVQPRPVGHLQDIPYRWSARLALLGVPHDGGDGRRPLILTVGPDAAVAHEPLPLPVFARHPERGIIRVGALEALWFNPDGPHGPEVCAQGRFDLGEHDVPRLVVEMLDAAAQGHPLVATPMISGIRYADEQEGATGPQTAVDWTLKDVMIGGSVPTWPGCVILPDEFQAPVHIGGRSYPMRTLYDAERWRALRARLEAAEHSEAGSPAERVLAALALVFAAMKTGDGDELAARLLEPHHSAARLLDPHHSLTLTEVVDGASRIAAHLDAQAERYRSAGGGR
jgi:hypothetical protein